MHMYGCRPAASNGALSNGSVKLVVVAVGVRPPGRQPRRRAERVMDDQQAKRRRHTLRARFDGPQQRRQQRGRPAARPAGTIAA